MKTKITLLLAIVALVTLSFTFAQVAKPVDKPAENSSGMMHSQPVGGLFADEVAQ